MIPKFTPSRRAAALSVAIGALSLAAPTFAAEPNLTATTRSGKVEGFLKGGSVAFLGIPYAAPPVGARRWAPPAAPTAWDGLRKATSFSASCPQTLSGPGGRAPWTPEYMIPGPMSEDCLYLNVWKPAKAVKGAPVLVFFHGGGNVEGSSSIDVYNGANLASRGIVVVNLNYRLGVLGFMSHPALNAEQGGRSGNYGLQDILTALKWVKANAAAFGGDPSRVTISGQSAGSGDVMAMITAPEAKGLFSRAIMESGAGWNPGATTLAAAAPRGEAFGKKIGAPTLEALRALPADALVKAAVDNGARFGPIVDGTLLPIDPYIAQETGRFNDTPMISGANADEGSGFESDYGQLTVDGLNKARDQKFWPVGAQAAKFYSATSDAEAGPMGKTLSRDRSQGYGDQWAKRRTPHSKYPLYLYHFDHPEPGPTQARYGTFHTAEIPYVFQNLDAPRPFTDEDHKVSDEMATRWVNFIKGGAPDAPGRPKWPAYSISAPKIMMLGDKVGGEALLTPEKRKLFDDMVDRGGRFTSRY